MTSKLQRQQKKTIKPTSKWNGGGGGGGGGNEDKQKQKSSEKHETEYRMEEKESKRKTGHCTTIQRICAWNISSSVVSFDQFVNIQTLVCLY